MRAIILAGGLGTRIKHIFPRVPKCLIPVGTKTFLEFQLNQLTKVGFNEFYLCLGHKSELVIEECNKFSDSYNLYFAVETEPLGTLGAVKHCFKKFALDSSFVMNGDTYIPIMNNEISVPKLSEAAVIWGVKADDCSQFGALQFEGDRVCGFSEKLRNGPGIVNSGMCFLTDKVLSSCESYLGSLETDLFLKLASEKTLRYRILSATQHFDIGTELGYNQFLKFNKDLIF